MLSIIIYFVPLKSNPNSLACYLWKLAYMSGRSGFSRNWILLSLPRYFILSSRLCLG